MRWLIIIIVIFAAGMSWLLMPSAISSQAIEEKVTAAWLESHAEAIAKAKASGRPILANFTGSDWCDWCAKLKEEVFNTKTFTDWAAANVILLELDYPQNKPQSAELQKQNDELAKKFNVEGFPMVLMLTAEGKKFGEIGYQRGGPQAWIDALKAASGMK